MTGAAENQADLAFLTNTNSDCFFRIESAGRVIGPDFNRHSGRNSVTLDGKFFAEVQSVYGDHRITAAVNDFNADVSTGRLCLQSRTDS